MSLIQIDTRSAVQVSVSNGGITFHTAGHYFTINDEADLDKLVENAQLPLSVILQVTRRCNFDCDFCSETTRMRDPSLKELDEIRLNLLGTPRIFLSGGEPLLRRDFVEIVEMFRDFIIGVPTNAVRGTQLAPKLAGKVSFVNVGLEGPRATTNRVRGDYDKILKGIFSFKEAGLPLSLSAVVLRSTIQALPYTYQIADVIGAGKLKLIMPIRKGNGLFLPEDEFLMPDESDKLFGRLVALKELHRWTPSLRMTTWTPQTEGYSILVYPNGETYAWPVYDAEDKVLLLGNLHEVNIREIWKAYPFKKNHYRKYLGKSIMVTNQ